MASIEELEASIQQYEQQLSQVDEAQKVCTNDTEKASLDNLRCDLQELLDLTRETLNEQKGTTNAEDECRNDNNDDDVDDPYAQEMALFMAELNACEANSTNELNKVASEELAKFKNEVDTLIGKKCSAPYTFAWGARSYHNALVCGSENDIERITSMDDIKVTVLFTNPIHRNMVPCPFYLDGNCHYEHKCRFSHGEGVRYTDLKEYNKPNFALLNNDKQIVLAKQSDNIWYKGVVLSSNFTEKTCQIRFEHNKQESTCDFHDLLPMEEEKRSDNATESELSDIEDDLEQIRHANLVAQSLLTPSSTEALGAWEVHTKGFGSRMLQKYGYVLGTGLGQNGEGIVVPISAQILPSGKSLDHCMNLREQANGDENLFSVEKKLKRQKERQELINAKAYEREKAKQDVFSFINNSVLNAMPSTSTSHQNSVHNNKDRPRMDYKAQSTKTLNVESFKIGEDIRRMEKEIQKLQDSLRRNKSESPITQQLNKQIDLRKTELDRMKRSEIRLKNEQSQRKDKSKLTIF